jgi:hypothetical protein
VTIRLLESTFSRDQLQIQRGGSVEKEPGRVRIAQDKTCSRSLTVSMYMLLNLEKLFVKSVQKALKRGICYGLGDSGMMGTPLLGLGDSGMIGTPLFGLGDSGIIGTPLA